MSKFHLYPIEAQELICDFLTLADDDPAEPQGKTILSMFVFMFLFLFLILIRGLQVTEKVCSSADSSYPTIDRQEKAR